MKVALIKHEDKPMLNAPWISLDVWSMLSHTAHSSEKPVAAAHRLRRDLENIVEWNEEFIRSLSNKLEKEQ